MRSVFLARCADDGYRLKRCAPLSESPAFEIGLYGWQERKAESQGRSGHALKHDGAFGCSVSFDGERQLLSSCGMRVQTDRPWKPDAGLLVETSLGERSLRARVVYCETLADTTFSVGLEFLAHTDA